MMEFIHCHFLNMLPFRLDYSWVPEDLEEGANYPPFILFFIFCGGEGEGEIICICALSRRKGGAFVRVYVYM